MCQIIIREPSFEIPYAKFEASIKNNPDGYGLVYPDDDGLFVFRSAKEADAEKLYRLINEELSDKKLMLHLRYTTAGETSLRNAHPFPILEKKKDGIDLRMAHNGTLGKYKKTGSKDSDTRLFVRDYVRPLFKRLCRGMEPEKLLKDEFVKKILEDQLTAASVLTFMDSEGNTLICNETGNGGKKEDKWYYSNTYSFNKSHREPANTTYFSGYSNLSGVRTKNTTKKDSPMRAPRKFTTRFAVKDTSDLLLLADETIEAISKVPDVAECLIKELLYELYKEKQL